MGLMGAGVVERPQRQRIRGLLCESKSVIIFLIITGPFGGIVIRTVRINVTCSVMTRGQGGK